MPVREAEAIVLRTYPLRESDRIVSFFTRQFGKCRGAARGARRAKSPLLAALQPLTVARIVFFERPHRELVTIDRCEILASMLAAHASDYAHTVVLGYVAEVADKLLPEHEVNDAVFRLLLSVLAALRSGAPPWLPLLYDLYWMVRLGGFLPDLHRCLACGRALASEEPAWFRAAEPGVLCSACRTAGVEPLAAESRACTGALAHTALERLSPLGWESATRAADLRSFLHRQLETHLERRVQSWKLLDAF